MDENERVTEKVRAASHAEHRKDRWTLVTLMSWAQRPLPICLTSCLPFADWGLLIDPTGN